MLRKSISLPLESRPPALYRRQSSLGCVDYRLSPVEPNHPNQLWQQQRSKNLQKKQTPQNPQSTKLSVPTLVVFLVWSVLLSGLGYVFRLLQTRNEDTSESNIKKGTRVKEPQDAEEYFIVTTAKGAKEVALCLFHYYQSNAWILGPFFSGFFLTVITWRILHPPGGTKHEKVKGRTGLQLGKVVSVMNGILIGLYILANNLEAMKQTNY